jgi:hypothetical protein
MHCMSTYSVVDESFPIVSYRATVALGLDTTYLPYVLLYRPVKAYNSINPIIYFTAFLACHIPGNSSW